MPPVKTHAPPFIFCLSLRTPSNSCSGDRDAHYPAREEGLLWWPHEPWGAGPGLGRREEKPSPPLLRLSLFQAE